LLLLIERFPRTVLFALQILFHSVQRSARNWNYFGGISVPFKRPCPSFRDRDRGLRALAQLFRSPEKLSRRAQERQSSEQCGEIRQRARVSLLNCSSLFMHSVQTRKWLRIVL